MGLAVMRGGRARRAVRWGRLWWRCSVRGQGCLCVRAASWRRVRREPKPWATRPGCRIGS